MLKSAFVSLIFAIKVAICSCNSEKENGFSNWKSESKIIKLGEIDQLVNESSGLIKAEQYTFWTHNDSGGAPRLFKINSSGQMLDSLRLKMASNIDWEDLTSDSLGHLYIGDFGNNGHARKDLKIYKVGPQKVELITFNYSDQTAFPSMDKNFDCEAFFWYKNELHLFTKSWEKKSLLTKHYVLPDKEGDYAISPKSTFQINAAVTAADVSPNGSQFALLTYGKVFFFGIEKETINFSIPKACIKTKRKQTEAIAFRNDKELIFSNEQGDLFNLRLPSELTKEL